MASVLACLLVLVSYLAAGRGGDKKSAAHFKRNSRSNSDDLPSLTLALHAVSVQAHKAVQTLTNSPPSASASGLGRSVGVGYDGVRATSLRSRNTGSLLPASSSSSLIGKGDRRGGVGGGVRMSAGTSGTLTVDSTTPMGETKDGVRVGEDVGKVKTLGGVLGDRREEKGDLAAGKVAGGWGGGGERIVDASQEGAYSSPAACLHSPQASRWSSRSQLRGSGYVLPDDAPKLVPVLCRDGSVVFTREQLTAPSSRTTSWVTGDTTLEEEVRTVVGGRKHTHSPF